MDARTSRYHDVYAHWQRSPEVFWAEAAAGIDWYEKPKKIFDKNAGIYGRWFAGATCNTCYNALDRHVARGRNDQPALIYDSPVTNTVKTFTYGRMLSEVQLLGAMLRDFGVEKGDRVIIYMPMVPEAVFAMLACARIGAIHSVVFGGFAREGARHPHRRRQAEGDPLRQLRHRGRARRALQAAARRGDQARQAQAAGLHDPAAPAMRGAADAGPRP